MLIALANIGDMRTGARFLRDQSLLTRTGLAAVEIARPVVRPDEPITGIAGYPLVVVRAGQYFRLERDLGTPAASAAELAAAPESARRAADDELTKIHRVGLTPTTPSPEPRRGADGRRRRGRPGDPVRRLRRVRAHRRRAGRAESRRSS